MADKKVDYNDILCQAIDTIVSRKIENLDYDKTIICTITDDNDASNGHYVVNDGSISFDVYSEDTSYVANDQVYVTVPKGDFTQTKIIISKYTADNDKDPISYVSPLEQVYLVSDNLVTTSLRDNTILANGRRKKVPGNSSTPPGYVRLIWEQNLTDSQNFAVQNNGVFDTLAIKAKFKCGLGTSFRMKSGHYGIIIEVISQPNKDVNTITQTTRYDFSTDEMFGNPYMFLSYVSQQKKIDISNLGNIQTINIYLYQSNDFIYRGEADIDDQRVPTPLNYLEDENGNIINLGETDDRFNNIYVEDLEIYFGMDLTKVADNTFTIYSNSSSTFSMVEAQTNASYNQKTIMPVWFNKTEKGEYLGYSDGIYDFVDSTTEPVGKNYTEDLYLAQSKRYERGAKLSQNELVDRGIPSVYELLQIYALGQDVKNLLEKIYRNINSNISKDYNRLMLDLQQYQTSAQKKATSSLYNSNTGVIASGRAYATILSHLVTWMGDENTKGSFVQKLQNILITFGTTYTNGVAASTSYSDALMNLTTIITNLGTEINNVETQGNNYFNQVKAQVTDDVVAVWSTWQKSFTNDITTCKDLFSQIQLIINAGSSGQSGDDITHTLNAVNIKFTEGRFDDYETEYEEFRQAWAKRYCIYWYRYEDSYYDENEQFMPKGWQRLTKYTNAGLPESFTTGDDYNLYYEIRPTDPRVVISVGNANIKQEQIQAVLIYDHQIYKSNILTFYNAEPVVDENTADANKGLYIQLTDEEIGPDGEIVKEDTYNSKETYQLYGITNYLVNQAERYTRRKLRARYKGVNKGDEYLRNDCTIYWYVPVNSTMLDVNHKELMEAGFSIYDPTYIRGKEELETLIAQIDTTSMSSEAYETEVDKLKKSIVGTPYPVPPAPYKNNYIDGYLMAYKDISLKQNGELDEASTEFFYQIKSYYVPTFTNNTIRCRVVKKKAYIYEAEQYFTFASYGTSGTDYSLSIVPATNKVAVMNKQDGKAYPLMLNVGLYDHNGDLMEAETALIDVSLKGTSYNGGVQQAPVIVGGTAPEISVARIKETSEYGWAVMKAEVSVTIHYDENGKPVHDKVNQSNTSTSTSISGDSGETLDTHPDRTINLESYYPIPWSAGNYYIEGASVVVYDSFGTNPSYYPDPYVLYYMDGDKQNQPVEKQKWEMKYFPVNQLKTSLISSYLPKIKKTNGDYCLQVPTMYLNDNNYVSSAVCTVDNEVKWVQPILIIQNRFSSPMMNDWDGQLTVDEKNGTILSSMVGAGKKEDDNTFSGVLMGDVATRAQDGALNPSQQGLYGFNHGEQSFGFKNDGTAFIGKAGKGRIEFDGNSGKIQSSSYNSANVGMMIDLDDGEIDMQGGFLYQLYDSSDPEHSQSQQWANGNLQSQNNNEINGYNNNSKYKSTGSRVTISVNDPFLKIDSPSIVYNTEALDGTYNEAAAYEQFWSTIDYYDNIAGLCEYLNQSWGIFDSESYLQANYKVNTTTGTGKVTPTQLADTPLTYMPKAGGYIKVDANLKVADLSSKFKNHLYNLNGDGQAYAQHGQDSSDVNDDIIIYKGDYLKLIKEGSSNYSNSSFKIEYFSKEQARVLGITSAWPTYDQFNSHIIVSVNGRVKSSVSQGSLTITISNYNTISDLATAITTEAIPTANNYQNSLKYKFLTWQDKQRAMVIYKNGPVKDSKTLMYVGTKEYYLQTDNYKKGTAANNYFDGEGLKFDLMRGTLDAYNFTLFAADNSATDGGGSYVKLSSSGNPYFQVSYNGDNRNSNVSKPIDLIKITKNDFILQSQNYYSNSGDVASSSGTQIDLKNGKITSYDFDLIAYDKGEGYEGSYFKLSNSGNPYIQVHYKDSAGANLDILNIGRKKFLLQSQNWSKTNKTGIQFDFREGKMMGYDFYLYMEGQVDSSDTNASDAKDSADQGADNSNSGKTGKIIIDSSDKSAPFSISSNVGANSKFKIYWDGSFTATAGVIGGWRVNEDSLWSHGTTDGLPNDNSFRLSSRGFNRKITTSKNTWDLKDNSVKMAVGDKLAITKDGTLYAKGAKLDDITANAATFDYANISNATITNSKIGAWTLNSSGELYAGSTYLKSNGYISGAYIDGGTVDGGTILGGTINISDNFKVDTSGNVTIAGNVNITGKSNLTLDSGSKFTLGTVVIDDLFGGRIATHYLLMEASSDYGGYTSYVTLHDYDFYTYYPRFRIDNTYYINYDFITSAPSVYYYGGWHPVYKTKSTSSELVGYASVSSTDSDSPTKKNVTITYDWTTSYKKTLKLVGDAQGASDTGYYED